jgi:hypothetical protein
MRKLQLSLFLIFPILFLAQEASAGLGKPLPRSQVNSCERKQLIEEASTGLLKGKSVSAAEIQEVREVLQRLPESDLRQIAACAGEVCSGGMDRQGWICLGVGAGLILLAVATVCVLAYNYGPHNEWVYFGGFLAVLVLVLPGIVFLLRGLAVALVGSKP